MPNGNDSSGGYGNHEYENGNGTGKCKYACGCWMGSCNSGGPTGLDPFGACPGNPKGGKLLGGSADYHKVVTDRIYSLERRLTKAEDIVKRVSPSKAELARKLAEAQGNIAQKDQTLAQILRLLQPPAP